MFRLRSLVVGVAGLTRAFFFGGMSTLGNSPRTILEELRAIQSTDVVLPIAANPVVCKNSDEPELPDFARVAPMQPLEACVILDGPGVGVSCREVCSTGPIVRQPNARLTLPESGPVGPYSCRVRRPNNRMGNDNGLTYP